MDNESPFLKTLKGAVTNDVDLVIVIDKIMNLINKNSKDINGKMDEDLRSELITYSIDLIRNKKIYKKFLN